jgi:hypothetical protein
MAETLLYAGSLVIVLWGIAHLVPTRAIVGGFAELTLDNERVLTMEWVAEGVTLIFAGVTVATATVVGGPEDAVARATYRVIAAMLLVLAANSAATGARTAVIWNRLCPVVKTTVASAYLVASFL